MDWQPLFQDLDAGVYSKKLYFEYYTGVFSEFSKLNRSTREIYNFIDQFMGWASRKLTRDVTHADHWRYISEHLITSDLCRLKQTCKYHNSNIKINLNPNDIHTTFHLKVFDNIWTYANRVYLRLTGGTEVLARYNLVIDNQHPAMSDILHALILRRYQSLM